MSRKIKVGILTFGDGRDFLQKPLVAVNEKFQKELQTCLEKDGFDVVTGDDIIWQNELAVQKREEDDCGRRGLCDL